MALLSHDAEPWIQWVHSSEVLVPDWTIGPNSDLDIQRMIDFGVKTGQMDMKDIQLVTAAGKTVRAITIGVALATMDGPLPVMDVLGFAVASAMTFHAWFEYFS